MNETRGAELREPERRALPPFARLEVLLLALSAARQLRREAALNGNTGDCDECVVHVDHATGWSAPIFSVLAIGLSSLPVLVST